ncbi:MAG: hypothetical protein IKE15_09105 [Clostridia bacterium]|nr:hypothetical protein [Clostridia bacterium]
MNRKIVLCLSIFMLLFMVVSVAAADLNLSDNGSSVTTIYYIAGTKDADEVLISARYAARAIAARWPDRQLNISRLDLRTIYHTTEDADKNNVFANVKNGNGGSVAPRKDAKPTLESHAQSGCELWFIVPASVSKDFIQNKEIADKVKTGLSSGKTRMHIVFIGSGVETAGLESEGSLYRNLPVDWIILKQDFTADEIEVNRENSSVHTGTYFTASLYGTPLDIEVDPDTQQFTMPENGRVLILTQAGNAAPPAVKDEQGNYCLTDFFVLEKVKDGKLGYGGAYTRDPLAKAQKYTIQAKGKVLRVYWYPDFESIQPTLEMAEEWERGDQTVILRMAKLTGNPRNYIVRIKYGENGQEAVPLSMSYEENEGCWKSVFTIGDNVNSTLLIPVVSLRMEDGNQAWSWNENEEYRVEKNIRGREIKPLDSAVTQTVVYAHRDQYGSFSGIWGEYFDYNPADNPVFKAGINEEAKAAGWAVTDDAKGFKVTCAPAAGTEVPDCTIELTGKEENSQATHEITVSLRDVSELIQLISVTYEPENPEVAVGSEVRIKAVIPADAAEQWAEAVKQLDGLPELSDMLLEAEAFSGEDVYTQSAALEEAEDHSRTASCTVPAGTDKKDDVYPLAWRIRDSEDVTWRESGPELSLVVRNTKPYEDLEKLTAVKREFELSGIPGRYTPKNLMQEIMPEQSVFGLFQDDETDITEIRMTLRPTSGITVNGETVETETYECTLSGDADLPDIQIGDTGEYILTLTASDGVNDSDSPAEISINVKSSFIRIAIYAGIGAFVLLLILIAMLIIRQKRKPAFDTIRIKAYMSGDDNPDHGNEMLEKSQSVPMGRYEKQGVDLATVMVLARQPEASASVTEVLEDIIVYPGRYEEVRLAFGKKAMSMIGRQSNQERIQKGDTIRFRVENTYVQFENSK